MPARSTTYTAQLDASQIRREAASLRALFEGQLRNIKIDFLNGSDLRRSVGDLRAIRTEMDAITASADRAGQEARDLAENIRQANQAARSGGSGGAGGASSALGGLASGLATAAAGYLTLQGARQIVDTAGNLSDLAAQIRRTNVAFVELSGGEKEAAANLEAVKAASGGAITDLTAQQTALTALNLKLASNATELKRVTEAARVVSVLSPVINDVQSALSELGLAAANLSFRRLDQLALSVDEVKGRMAALKAENSALTDSQAFLNASVDALIAKGGAVINSMEAQATGVEQLRGRIGQLNEEIALLASGPIDKAAGALSELARDISVGIGGGTANDLVDSLRDAAGRNRQTIGGVIPFGFGADIAQQQDDAALALQQLEDLQARGIQISQEFQNQTEALARSILGATSATEEQGAALDQVFSTISLYADGGIQAAAANEESAASAEENAQALRDAAAAMIEADPASKQLIQNLLSIALTSDSSGLSVENFADKVDAAKEKMAAFQQQLAGVNAAQQSIGRSILNAGLGITDIVGQGAAQRLVQDTVTQIEGEFEQLRARAQSGSISEIELKFAAQQIEKSGLATFEAITQADEDRKQAEKEAQRERERANKEFTRDYEQAAKQAAREMESTLKSVPGLFGTTQVTQEDFDLQKLGLRTDAADEFLRRLKAEVNSGQDLFPDVSLEKAQQALERIGANVGDGSAEAIVKALDKAWQDSSLFSDIQNIEELINPQAVQNAIDQAAKAKAGQQNLLDYFGLESPEAAGAAVAGVGSSIASTIKDEITTADVGGAVGADIAEKTQGAVAESLNLDLASVAITPGFGADLAAQITGEIGAAGAEGAASAIIKAISDDFANSGELVALQAIGAFLNTAITNGFMFADLTAVDLAHPIMAGIAEDFTNSPELVALQAIGGYLSTVVTNGFMFADLAEIDMAAPIYNKLNADFILPDHVLSLQRLGEGMAGSIAFFFKPSEEADFAAPIMTKMQADFVSETVTTKLAGIGKTLSQRIHDEFLKETGRLEWAETVVDTIGSQAVGAVTAAVAGAAEGQ